MPEKFTVGRTFYLPLNHAGSHESLCAEIRHDLSDPCGRPVLVTLPEVSRKKR
jgi:hypothetical protein